MSQSPDLAVELGLALAESQREEREERRTDLARQLRMDDELARTLSGVDQIA